MGSPLLGSTLTWAHPQACAHSSMWEQSALTETCEEKVTPGYNMYSVWHTPHGPHSCLVPMAHPAHWEMQPSICPSALTPPCIAPWPRTSSPILLAQKSPAAGACASLPTLKNQRVGVLPSTPCEFCRLLFRPPQQWETFPATQFCPAAKTLSLVSWATQRWDSRPKPLLFPKPAHLRKISDQKLARHWKSVECT